MRIRKCDRCGETYTPYENDFNTVGTYTFNIDEEEIGTSNCYDLCPRCREEFKSWLNAHKSKGVTTPIIGWIADDCK